jgi:hypothetical protein
MVWGFFYFTSGLDQDPYGIYDDPSFEGFSLIFKVLSLSLPCWVLGGTLLADMWKDGKAGFFFCLAIFMTLCLTLWDALPYNGFIFSFSFAAPFIYFVINHLLWLHFRAINTTAHIPRVALLYRQYFGIDGEYFAMKSASTQSLSVLLQARAKLLRIGFVVADPITEGWYWGFFCVLFLNCVVPPLLLSSKRLWLRQQGAMLFDISCDLFYILGFTLLTLTHQGNVAAMFPTNAGLFFSNLFPVLRILSIGRALVTLRRGRHRQNNMQTTAIDNSQALPPSPSPSRLTPKAASFFASLSLLMFALVICWYQTAYPFDRNPCRPCECTAGRVLKRCEYSGTHLYLAARGITRVSPGAFVEGDLPHLKVLTLGLNAITVVESGTFTNLPALRQLNIGQNRVNVTSWFGGYDGGIWPGLRFLVPTDSGLASFERNAFANNSQLEMLGLSHNSLASVEALGGVLSDLEELRHIMLVGNPLTCEDLRDVAPFFDGQCI